MDCLVCKSSAASLRCCGEPLCLLHAYSSSHCLHEQRWDVVDTKAFEKQSLKVNKLRTQALTELEVELKRVSQSQKALTPKVLQPRKPASKPSGGSGFSLDAVRRQALLNPSAISIPAAAPKTRIVDPALEESHAPTKSSPRSKPSAAEDAAARKRRKVASVEEVEKLAEAQKNVSIREQVRRGMLLNSSI